MLDNLKKADFLASQKTHALQINRLTLLAYILSLQFTEISEYLLPHVIEHQNHDFSHTLTVNFAMFPPLPR